MTLDPTHVILAAAGFGAGAAAVVLAARGAWWAVRSAHPAALLGVLGLAVATAGITLVYATVGTPDAPSHEGVGPDVYAARVAAYESKHERFTRYRPDLPTWTLPALIAATVAGLAWGVVNLMIYDDEVARRRLAAAGGPVRRS